MPRMIVTLFAAAFVSGAGISAPTAATAQDDDEDCTVIRYLPNGRRIIKPALRQPGTDAAEGVRRSYATASGDGSASSVSVSSSSRGAGHASASASSSSNGRNGRTVTTTHDDNGCTIVINEGRRRGAKR